jgi:hypothetical protein
MSLQTSRLSSFPSEIFAIIAKDLDGYDLCHLIFTGDKMLSMKLSHGVNYLRFSFCGIGFIPLDAYGSFTSRYFDRIEHLFLDSSPETSQALPKWPISWDLFPSSLKTLSCRFYMVLAILSVEKSLKDHFPSLETLIVEPYHMEPKSVDMTEFLASLPPMLTKLSLAAWNHSYEITSISSLSRSLRYLKLDISGTHSGLEIPKIDFPPCLEYLNTRIDEYATIRCCDLPSSLTSLTFDTESTSICYLSEPWSIKFPHLKKLDFPFDHTDAATSLTGIPPELEEYGWCINKPVKPNNSSYDCDPKGFNIDSEEMRKLMSRMTEVNTDLENMAFYFPNATRLSCTHSDSNVLTFPSKLRDLELPYLGKINSLPSTLVSLKADCIHFSGPIDWPPGLTCLVTDQTFNVKEVESLPLTLIELQADFDSDMTFQTLARLVHLRSLESFRTPNFYQLSECTLPKSLTTLILQQEPTTLFCETLFSRLKLLRTYSITTNLRIDPIVLAFLPSSITYFKAFLGGTLIDKHLARLPPKLRSLLIMGYLSTISIECATKLPKTLTCLELPPSNESIVMGLPPGISSINFLNDTWDLQYQMAQQPHELFRLLSNRNRK